MIILVTGILEKNMKMLRSVVTLICVLFVVSSLTTYAQNPRNGIEASGIIVRSDARLVVVEPDNYPTSVGNLNRAVESQLTDDNTIFVLKRNGVYWTDTRIENANFRLHIRAEQGEGNPPHIRPAVDLGASVLMFNTTKDVILEGLFLQGLNEAGVQEDILVHVGEDAIIIVDNCWLVGTYEYQIRTLGSNNSIYATNNIACNAGRNSNDQQGRFIDTQGRAEDTVYVENNTLYNMGHSFVRNSGGGLLGYLYINHNTVMNVSQYMWAGSVQKMDIKNNIFRNVYTIGEYLEYLERGWITINKQPAGLDDKARNLAYNYNNSCYLDTAFYPLIAVRDAFHTDRSYTKAPEINRLYTNPNDSLATVTYENNIVEKIDFTDPPETDSIYLDWTKQWMMGRDKVPFGNDPQPNTYYDHTVFFDRWNETTTYMGVAPGHFSVDLIRDFSYSPDFKSYTAAENGYPLGDLNWFPELKAKWEEGIILANDDDAITIPKAFRIIGNYPNPFNPSTTIVYELASQAKVKLEAFNILGQSVRTVEIGDMSAGRHEFTFNASDLTSGVYIIRMQTGNEARVQVHSVALIK